jgi:hypothetical protein
LGVAATHPSVFSGTLAEHFVNIGEILLKLNKKHINHVLIGFLAVIKQT